MLTTVSLGRSRFDDSAFQKALRAADYERCSLLVASPETAEAVLASSILALRERRYVDVIGLLSDFPQEPRERRLARDVLLGAALALTRDFVAGRRLIDRALTDLQPGEPFYDEAIYYEAVIAWMQHDYHQAELEIDYRSSSRRTRTIAPARTFFSRGSHCAAAKCCDRSTNCRRRSTSSTVADQPDQYYRANALFTLALLCRELPLGEIADRVRGIHETLPWTTGLALERFQVTRLLAAVRRTSGNELAAFAGFKSAARFAPSEHWSVLCFNRPRLLARNTGENAFAAELLQEAHDLAQRLSWNVTGEERSALLVLAELFADERRRNRGAISGTFPLAQRVGYSAALVRHGPADPRPGSVFTRDSPGYGSVTAAKVNRPCRRRGRSTRTSITAGAPRFAPCTSIETTRDRRWLQRATRKIAPWADSWIARRITEVTNASCVSLELVPPAKREVLELVRAGRRNSEIARVLGRSPNTVRNQIAQLFQTFNVKSRAELVSILAKQSTVTRLRPRTAKA